MSKEVVEKEVLKVKKIPALEPIVRHLDGKNKKDLSAGGAKRWGNIEDINEIMMRPVVDFILQPYQHGYWHLVGKWNYEALFFKKLIQEVGVMEVSSDGEDLDNLNPFALLRKLSSDASSRISIINKLTFINSLFEAASSYKTDGKLKTTRGFDFLDEIDFGRFVVEYSSAIDIFKSRIWHDGYLSRISDDMPGVLHKSGYVFFIEYPKTNGSLEVCSTEKEGVQVIKEFYESLGILEDAKISRVFAPDDALFAPNFKMLSAAYVCIIKDKNASNFEKALSYYIAEDYKHCVSTLGLIGEDYLTRIYVSLLRKQCSPDLTLGQIRASILTEIGEIIQPPKLVLKPIDEFFEKIDEIKGPEDVIKIKNIVRDAMKLIKEDRKYYSEKIEDVSKVQTKVSPFPASVKANIDELLDFRNVASHNTRVPLGRYEADRTLYSLVGLVTWWQDRVDNTDWSKNKEEVLRDLIRGAKSK